jgi:hypothetical protein
MVLTSSNAGLIDPLDEELSLDVAEMLSGFVARACLHCEKTCKPDNTSLMIPDRLIANIDDGDL